MDQKEATLEVVDHWTTKLTGLSQERIIEARERLRGLDLGHLTFELCQRADVDSVAAACMLTSALDELVQRGVPETKLRAKLRADLDIWPTVVELIASRCVLALFDPNWEIEMDSRKNVGGPDVDLRLVEPGSGRGVSVEFRAVGLSRDEVSFFGRAADVIPRLIPRAGVVTQHIAIDNLRHLRSPNRRLRRSLQRDSRERGERLPGHVRGLNGAVVVGHDAEKTYVVRARSRVEEALRKFRSKDDCWVALWWSNGAPALAVRDVFSAIQLPANVVGLMLIGAAVAVPDPEIHYYRVVLPRKDLGSDCDMKLESPEDHPLAAPIFEAIESSSGVRTTMLVDPHGMRRRRRAVLNRDGSRPILPFNLLISRDPPSMQAFAVGRDDLPRGGPTPLSYPRVGRSD